MTQKHETQPKQPATKRADLDKDGDPDISVNGRLDKYAKQTVSRLESLCSAEPSFMPKLEELAQKLDTKVEWLINVMMMESSLDPARKNPNSTASGLIQFMRKTAAGLGTTCAALRRMTATKQLDWVHKYFAPFAGRLSSQAQVYAAVGAGQVSDNNNKVFFRAGSKEYNANKVWDANRDGKITQGEMGRIAGRFGAGEQFDINGSGDSKDSESEETETETAPKPEAPAAQPGGGGEGEVTVTVTSLKPVKPGHIISDSVGAGGNNHEGDVAAVQTALTAHGFSPGKIDHANGPNTMRAIRRFQRGFMKNPDGLVEVGKPTEQHLTSGNPPVKRDEQEEREEEEQAKQPTKAAPQRQEEERAERQPKPETDADEVEVSAKGSQQMTKLVGTANDVAGQRPGGKCYKAVKHHITNAGGYGNIKNIYTDPRFASAQGEAHMFADTVNANPGKFGLERLSIENPYDAPTGSIVVVSAGSPGTHHKTAGDITVKGPGDSFYNDGSMGYKGRNAWPPKRGGVIGVYKPK
ncbi:MAG: peptidoglycan-binding domain-containing protein [Kofleriaceae bacterium]